jgi:hypothetical protein
VAIQDITLVVKTKVDQLNKLEKSIDTVEKKIGKVSKKVIVLDTSKAVRNVEKLNDSLEKASRFVKRFSQEAKGFTGVRAISNELGMMNQQLAQARKAFNDTSAAMKAYKEANGKLEQADKNRIRTTQQQNAALSILAITYKKLRIENDAFVAASARAFSQKKGGDGLTGGDTFGSIQKRVKVLKEWPKTLDASARALQEVNFLLNLAVKDSKAFNLLAKTKIELELKEKKILEAITPEKKKQTEEEKKQVDFLQRHVNELDDLKKKYGEIRNIGSQIKNIFSGLGLGTQFGSSAALFGGGMISSGIGGLLGGIGLGGTPAAKAFSGLGKTTNILASVDAIGKLAVGAQGLAVAADQAARSVFSVGKALTNFVTKGFISKWESSYFQKFLRSGMQDLDITRASQRPQLSNFDGQLQNYLNDVQASLSGLDTPMRRQAPKTGPSRFASIDARASGLSWFEMLFPGNIKEIFTGMSMMGGSPFAAAQDMGVDAQKWDQYNKDLANDQKFTDLVNQEIKLKRQILNLEKARANAVKKLTDVHKTEAQKQQEMIQKFDASMKATKTRVQAASPGSMIGGRQMPSPYGLGRGDMVPTATEKAIRRQNEQRMKQARISGKILGNDIKLLDNHGKIVDKQAQSAKISKNLFSTSQRRNRSLRARLKLMGKSMGMSSNTKDLESMMLGAGFPLLFGGGVGSVGGSIAGSGLASMFGVSGFGAQIFGSAIGQQLETLVKRAGDLGRATQEMNFDKLEEQGIVISGEMKHQVELLKEMGKTEQARLLISRQVQQSTGASGDVTKDISRSLTILNKGFTDLVNSAGTSLGSFLVPFNVALGGLLKALSIPFVGINTLVTGFRSLIQDMPVVDKWFDKLDKKLQDMGLAANKIARAFDIKGDRLMTTTSLQGQKKIGQEAKSFAGQRFNLGIDEKILRQTTRGQMEDELRKEGVLNYTGTNKNKIATMNRIQQYYKQVFDSGQLQIDNKRTVLDEDEGIQLGKMEREVKFLERQNELKQKILAADKINDDQLSTRLTFESQALEIRNKLGEDLRTNLDTEQQVLLVKKAIADIDALRIATSQQLTKEEQRVLEVKKQIGFAIKDGIVDGLNQAIDGTKTLGEVASSVFRKISNALLNYGVESALIGMTGGKGGFFSNVFGRASGGPVTGGSPYIVGEKGPELFVPGSSGNIVPNHAMGGANVVVNVDASGSSVEGDAGQAEQLGSMLAAAVQSEIANQQRPGGLLARR